MKKILSIFLLLLLKVNAQGDMSCSQLSGNIYQLEWSGVQGRSYFIQASTDNMATWDYLPDIRFGQGNTLRMAFEKVSDEMYLRLVFTDVFTVNPDTADFDGDGWTNLEEVLIYKTSPFVFNPQGPGPGANVGQGAGPNAGQGAGPNFGQAAAGVIAQFELEITVVQDGTPGFPIKKRLDAGFNVISVNGAAVNGGVPSISVSRDTKTTTRIKLTDLSGENGGATFNLLQLQSDIVPNSILPPATSMVDAVSLVIPYIIPFTTVSIQGDLDPAGSNDYWLLQPMDITVSNGISAESGPDGHPESTGLTTKEHLQEGLQLRLIFAPNDTFNQGSIWGIRGVAPQEGAGNGDEEGVEKFYAIEISDAHDDPLNRALQSRDRVVIFDGHSNFGIGPNFVREPVKTIGEFTNYGVGYTDIPRSYRLGHPNLVVPPPPPELEEGQAPHPEVPQLTEADVHMGIEGWGYLNLGDGNIRGVGNLSENYSPEPLHVDNGPNPQRFPNNAINQNGLVRPMVGLGQVFNSINNGVATWHYSTNGANGRIGSMRLMIDLPGIDNEPGADVPEHLGYRAFFYNACNTGLDYIESFDSQGTFIYTTQTCAVSLATRAFIDHFVDGRDLQFIVDDMNARNLGFARGVDYGLHEAPNN